MKFPDIGGGKSGGSDSGKYVRLKDGDKVTGVFQGEPRIFRLHWTDGKSSVCPGKAGCSYCMGGDKARFRFQLNLLSKIDGVWMARIYEGGYQIFKDLKELHESDYNLEETMVSISRKGEGTDTSYSVLPMKNNGGLGPKDFSAIKAVPLNVLGEKTTTDSEVSDSDDSIPF